VYKKNYYLIMKDEIEKINKQTEAIKSLITDIENIDDLTPEELEQCDY